MQRTFAIISAAAGAIVGLVKLAGLISGSQWLGDNWKPSLGYVAATFVGGLGLVYLSFVVRPSLGKRVLARGRRRPREVSTLEAIASSAAGAAFFLAFAAFIATRPDFFWWLGAAVLAYALMMGGVFVWIQHQGSTTCPYCLQTISGNALVCRHCSSDLTRRSQETPLSKQRCPYCAETISVNALVCPRCGRDLPERSLEDDELRLVWL